ncbi:hypothetical protein CES86_0650 [Brucella lupini]|uniref:Uncharacterized protein n=2 Tax=Brucella TaxID=234 RepID=A0A256GXE0_9HYPH|nr:hypothetical protein CES86_0650 [Brucella lupini]
MATPQRMKAFHALNRLKNKRMERFSESKRKAAPEHFQRTGFAPGNASQQEMERLIETVLGLFKQR